MRIIYDLLRDGLSAINTAADQLNTARQQVSTGRRISGAGDDPAAVEQAIRERATLAGIDAYTRSHDAAAARLASVDNILSSVVDKITAAIVAGTGARGTTATPAARAAAAQAVRTLRDGLVADFNSTFNGTSLFSGTASQTPAFAQVAGVWTYQGDTETTQVEIERGHVVSTTLDGARIVQGGDSTDLFTALDDLETAITAGDSSGIGTALAALDRAFDRVLEAQGRLGADEKGLDDASARLAALRLAGEARRSTLEDVNLAEAVTKLTQADTAYRAALSAVSTAERRSLLDYLR